MVRDLISIFDTRTFYYSLDYDLSNTLQRKAEQSGAVAAVSPDARSNHGVPGGNGEEEEAEGQQQVEVMDKRFFWNESLAKKFAEKNVNN